LRIGNPYGGSGVQAKPVGDEPFAALVNVDDIAYRLLARSETAEGASGKVAAPGKRPDGQGNRRDDPG